MQQCYRKTRLLYFEAHLQHYFMLKWWCHEAKVFQYFFQNKFEKMTKSSKYWITFSKTFLSIFVSKLRLDELVYSLFFSLFSFHYSLLENQVVDYHPGVTNLSHQQKIKTKILLMVLILQPLGHLLYFHPWQMVL